MLLQSHLYLEEVLLFTTLPVTNRAAGESNTSKYEAENPDGLEGKQGAKL